MKRLFRIDPANPHHLQVAQRAAQFAVDCNEPVDVMIQSVSKTREQEMKYHALFQDFAEHKRLYGKKLDAESWKRLLIDAFKHDTKGDPDLKPLWDDFGATRTLPALNHEGFVMVGEQSRRFKKKLAMAFIDWLEAYYATTGDDLP